MKNFFKLTTLAGVMVFLIATISLAKDIHVPGDFDKIQDALNAAVPGDRVLVAAGTYEENITLKSGVELIGAGADVTTIRASTGTVVTADGVGVRTKIIGFTIDGVDKSGSGEHGIYCINNSAPTISNVTITNTGENGIYCDYSYPTISGVTITNTGGNGIYCDSSSSPTISDVTITNAGGSGIHCYYYSSPTISNVTITNIGSHGIYCGNNSSPTISGVTITNIGSYGIYLNFREDPFQILDLVGDESATLGTF